MKTQWERFVVVSLSMLEKNDRYQLLHVLAGPVPEDEIKTCKNPNLNVYKR